MYTGISVAELYTTEKLEKTLILGLVLSKNRTQCRSLKTNIDYLNGKLIFEFLL